MKPLVIILLLLVTPTIAAAQLSSSNYQIDGFSIGTTDVDSATSTNFEVEYADDGTLVYDAPSGGGGGSSGGSAPRIELTETIATTATPVNHPVVTFVPVEIPFIGTVPIPVPSQPSSPASVQNSQPDSVPQPDEEPALPVPQNDNILTITIVADEDVESQSARATFDDGEVVRVVLPNDAFVDGEQVELVVTRLPLSTSLIPIGIDPSRGTMYGIEIMRGGRRVAEPLSQPLQVSLLYPGDTLREQTTPYQLLGDRTGWERMDGYELGSNIITFPIFSSQRVGLFMPDTDTDFISLTFAESEPVVDTPDLVFEPVTEVSESTWRDMISPRILMFAGGIVAVLVILLVAIAVMRSRRNQTPISAGVMEVSEPGV